MHENMLQDIRKELKSQANPERAKLSLRYFKTGKGEYGEGDVFLGLTVPQLRTIAKKYKDMSLKDTVGLLKSKIHEERMIALFLLIDDYKKGDEKQRKKIFDTYIKNTKYINNWDLIDISAGYIVGAHLANRSKDVLYEFARSKNLWKKRIAIMATFYDIMRGKCGDTLAIAEILLYDEHDLIQKAVGWMLREVGKRCSPDAEEAFLKEHYHSMPRTMLRYAIEKFPEKKRQKYLKGQI